MPLPIDIYLQVFTKKFLISFYNKVFLSILTALGAANVWLDISPYLLSCYEDDPGDFIEQVLTQDETWVQSKKCRANIRSALAHPLL